MEAKCIAGGKDAERLAVIRVNGDRLLQQCLRDEIVLSSHPPVMQKPPHHEIPGIHTLWRFTLGAKALPSIELGFDGSDDCFSNLVLHCEHIGKAAVVAFRPDMAASGCVIELHGDAYAVAVFAHATLDHIADAELFRDLLHM